LTDRDRRLLLFAAEHRLVLGGHVQALLGDRSTNVERRLRRLARAGFLERRPSVFHRGQSCYLITHQALQVLGSGLPRPRLDWGSYDHDVGLGWLWLAAHAGVFGPMREVISERRLRSRDATEEGRRDPAAVRLGGLGPGGRERLHYPDLLLVDGGGKRIALELELTVKARTRREGILGGYGADARIDAVVYLITNASIGRQIAASARKLGVSHLVRVQQARLGRPQPLVDRDVRRGAQRRGPTRSAEAAR
jgi:hypothetical protein